MLLASSGADVAPAVSWDALSDTPARTKFGRQNLYYQSKLFDIVIAKEFARRHAAFGIVFSALHPGALFPVRIRASG